jgi:hypothetical protein
MFGRSTLMATGVLPRLRFGKVDLSDRGARHGDSLELVEKRADARTERLLDDVDRQVGIERRHLILQLRQLHRDFDR